LADDDEKYFSGSQAAEFLGVKAATLYAYASRGMIESVAAESGRERAYRLTDLIKLRQSSRGFKSQKDQEIPTWTGPVIKSAITEIRNEGHRYRGQDASELARKGIPFELVAELLWETDASQNEWQATKPLAVPKHLKKLASDEVDYLDLVKILIASVEISDPVTRKLLGDDLFATARRLIVTMALTPGFSESSEGYIFDAQYPIAQTLLASLRASRSREKAAVVNSALVLCADHELNASALAARIAASCDASLYSSLLSAVGTFSGSLHGLASRRTENIVSTSMKFKSTNAWLKDYLKHSDTIPGFGTDLYAQGDPRARFLLEAAQSIANKNANLNRLLEIVESVEEQIGTKPNLDIGLAAITYALSLPPGSGSTIFAVSRTAGWIAHAFEQRAYGGLIRPRAKYIGKTSKD
jgi:citrate synthase